MFKGEGGGQREESVVANKVGGGIKKIDLKWGGEGIIRIQRSLKGSGKFHRGKTIILPPPSPLFRRWIITGLTETEETSRQLCLEYDEIMRKVLVADNYLR